MTAQPVEYDPTATVDRDERIILTEDAMRRPSTLGRLYGLPPEMEALTDVDEPIDPRLERLEAAYAEHLADLGEADRQRAIADQVERLGIVLKSLGAELKTTTEHLEDTARQKESLEARITRLKTFTQSLMQGEGIEKHKTALVSIWLHPNNASIEVTDLEAVPPEWKRATVTLPLTEYPEDFIDWAQGREAAGWGKVVIDVPHDALLKHFKSAGVLQNDGRVIDEASGEVVEVPGVEFVTSKKHVRSR